MSFNHSSSLSVLTPSRVGDLGSVAHHGPCVRPTCSISEERRRTKAIPHAFGESAVLKLMYAALIRAAERWHGITITESERRQMRVIRAELERAHAERTVRVAGAVHRIANRFVQQELDLTAGVAGGDTTGEPHMFGIKAA